jgi:hypothetical protein
VEKLGIHSFRSEDDTEFVVANERAKFDLSVDYRTERPSII